MTETPETNPEQSKPVVSRYALVLVGIGLVIELASYELPRAVWSGVISDEVLSFVAGVFFCGAAVTLIMRLDSVVKAARLVQAAAVLYMLSKLLDLTGDWTVLAGVPVLGDGRIHELLFDWSYVLALVLLLVGVLTAAFEAQAARRGETVTYEKTMREAEKRSAELKRANETLAGEINRRRRVEEELRTREEFLEAIQDATLDAMEVIDGDGTLLWQNEVARLVYQKPVGSHCPPDRWQTGKAVAQTTRERVFYDGIARDYEVEVPRPGARRTYWVRVAPMRTERGDVYAVLETTRDVTEQLRQQRAVAESERRYRSFVENTPLPITRMDRSRRYIFANRAFLDLAGLQERDVLGRGTDLLEELLHDVDKNRLRATVSGVLARRDRLNQEVRLRSRTGEWRWFSYAAYPWHTAGGELGGVEMMFVDVSERRNAEQQRDRLAAAVAQAAEAVAIADDSGVVLYVNPAFEKVTGYTQADMAGQTARLLRGGFSETNVYSEVLETLADGKAWRAVLTARRKNGEVFDADVAISPVQTESDGLMYFIGILRDVTTEVNLEKQLRQAQKMEALGTLAGGIAHDFNNVLGVISGHTELASTVCSAVSGEPGDQLKEHLSHIMRASKRAGELVRQILTFSRRSQRIRRPLRLDLVVREAAELLRASFPATLAFRVRLTKDCGMTLADPTEVHQVVMNLCTNAYQSVDPVGGQVSLDLEPVKLEQQTVTNICVLEPGPYLHLCVSDNGKGIDEETLQRIFDPFFTTKAPGEGTGLGLSTVHGIVTDCGGGIQVHTELGRGTDFHVYFPVCEEAQTESVSEGTEPPRGEGHLLLVDDEPEFAETTSRLLRNLGYEVTVFTQTQQALEAFRTQPDAFDLLITDLTMPHMTGLELLSAIREFRPGMPALMMSGFGGADASPGSPAAPAAPMLQKPFSKDALARAVHDAIHEQDASAQPPASAGHSDGD